MNAFKAEPESKFCFKFCVVALAIDRVHPVSLAIDRVHVRARGFGD